MQTFLLLLLATNNFRGTDELPASPGQLAVSSLMQRHCLKCHGPDRQDGAPHWDQLVLPIKNAADIPRWQAVVEALQSGRMPPEDAAQPTSAERNSAVSHLKAVLLAAESVYGPGYQYQADEIRIPAATADEPRVEAFDAASLQAAAKYLDEGAVAWTRSRRCITCHTNGTYMAERPRLTEWLGRPEDEVLQFFQTGVPAETDSSTPQTPRPAYRLIWQTLGLAQWDRYVTKQTGELTDRSLRAMLMQQRDNGSWMHYTGVRELPHISTDFELAVRAAWAVAAAPDWLQNLHDERLLLRVDRMRDYLRQHRPGNDYELALKLQVANFMPEAVKVAEREAAITMLRNKQQADGGWSTRRMSTIENWASWHPEKDKLCLEMLREETAAEMSASDPLMTGFAIVLLREAGVSADDEQIQRGIAWLKANQRISGRWWMKSLFKQTYHFSSYMGTMQAMKALALCGELDVAAVADSP